ncbi:hypothetical protein MTR67_043039 [Solanum verrucosum]|uniref:F-box associated domain-containing protein n=1 Tax=Solanum verrucosum TaxID=315347 RepID=A0AAF0ZUR4_SOLVR|nr:hypothetical protein MTR67_043039 [Solanum verrucosum]
MLPDALAGVTPTNLSIMLFEESLVVVNYGREIDGASCEVWVMKQYGVLKSWSRLYRINLVVGMEKVVITNFSFISAHLAQTPHSNTFLVRRYIRTRKTEHYSLFQESKNRPFSLDLHRNLISLSNANKGISKLLAIAMASCVC